MTSDCHNIVLDISFCSRMENLCVIFFYEIGTISSQGQAHRTIPTDDNAHRLSLMNWTINLNSEPITSRLLSKKCLFMLNDAFLSILGNKSMSSRATPERYCEVQNIYKKVNRYQYFVVYPLQSFDIFVPYAMRQSKTSRSRLECRSYIH